MLGKSHIKDDDLKMRSKAHQVGHAELAKKKQALFAIAKEVGRLRKQRREVKQEVQAEKEKYKQVQRAVAPTTWLVEISEEGEKKLAAAEKKLRDWEKKRGAIKRAIKDEEEEYNAAKQEFVELIDRETKHLKKQRDTLLRKLKDPEGFTVKDRLEWLVAARDRQYRALEQVLAEGAARYPLRPKGPLASEAPLRALNARIGDASRVADVAIKDVDPSPTVGRVRDRVLEDLVLLDKKIAREMWVVRELDARRAAYREFKHVVQHTKSFWTYVERIQDWHGRFLRLGESVTTVTRRWKGFVENQSRKQKSLTGSRDFALELGVGVSVGAGDAVKLAEMGFSIVVAGTLSHDDDRRLRATLSLKLVPNLKVEISGGGAKLFELTAKLGFTVANQTYAFVDAKHFAYYLSFRVANLVHFASKFSEHKHGRRAQLHQHIDVYSEEYRALLKEMMSSEKVEEMRTYLSGKPVVKAHRKRLGAPDLDLGFKSTFAGDIGASGSWQRTTFQRQRLLLDGASSSAPQKGAAPQADFWQYESRDYAASLYQSMGFLLKHHTIESRRPEAATLRLTAKKEWLERHHELTRRQREREQQVKTYNENKRMIQRLQSENGRDWALRMEWERRVSNLKRAKRSADTAGPQKKAEKEIQNLNDRIARREDKIERLERGNASLNLHQLPGQPGDGYWTLCDGERLDAFQQAIDRGKPGDERHLAALAYHYNVIVKVHTGGRPGMRTVGPPVEEILKARRAVKTLHLRKKGGPQNARYHALLPNQGGTAPQPDTRVHLRRVAYQSAAYDTSLQTTRAQQQAQHPAAHRLLTEVRHGTTRSISGALNVSSWINVSVTGGYTYIGANANPDNDGHYLNVQIKGGIFARALDHNFEEAYQEARVEELDGKENLTGAEQEELAELKSGLAGPYDDTSAEEAHKNFEQWGQNETAALKEEASKLAKTLFGELPQEVAEGILNVGANGLKEVGLEFNRAQRYVTFNFIRSENAWRLQYVRWVYQQSSKVGGSAAIPTGTGIDPTLSASLSWSKAVALQERLGVNTLTYVMTVFNGLKRRPDGYEQWQTFLKRNRAQLRVLFRNVACQKEGKGGVRAEARAMEEQANKNMDIWKNSKWAAHESEWLKDTAHPVAFVEACETASAKLKPKRVPTGWSLAPQKDTLANKLTTLLWRASQVAEHENQVSYPWRRKTVYLVPPKGGIHFEVAFDPQSQRFVATRLPRVAGRPETVRELLQASKENKAYFDTTIVDVLRNPELAGAKSILPFYQHGFELELVIRLPDNRAFTVQARQPDGEEALQAAVLRMARKAKKATRSAQTRRLGREAKREEAATKELSFKTLLKLHPVLAGTWGQWKLGDKNMQGTAWEEHAQKTWGTFLRDAPHDWFEQVLDAIRGRFWGLPVGKE